MDRCRALAAGLFLTETNTELAVVLYGHIEAHQPVWGGERSTQGRAMALEWLRKQPHADLLMAKGAAMTGDETITLLLDELAIKRTQDARQAAT